MNMHYPFELPPLRYPYDALEPYIDAQVVELHYNKHFKNYIDNLNRALENYPAYHNWSLERLIKENCCLPFQIQTNVRNNAGGVYNHYMYFNIMGKTYAEKQSTCGHLRNAIIRCFGSMDKFYARLKECSMAQFGSGWGWLAATRSGNLKIINTLNQDTPLTCGLCPVIPLDVWEHAYYLQYQNRRGEYIDAFFHVLNFESAEQNYLACISPCSA